MQAELPVNSMDGLPDEGQLDTALEYPSLSLRLRKPNKNRSLGAKENDHE